MILVRRQSRIRAGREGGSEGQGRRGGGGGGEGEMVVVEDEKQRVKRAGTSYFAAWMARETGF